MLHVVSDEEFEKLWAEIEAAKAARAEKMPDERAALLQLNEAVTRLKELGWNDADYCPKDGSMFSAITHGSTGVHECNYQGEWPTGSWWIYDGDVWPSRPILWRPRKDSDPKINLGLAMDYQCCDTHNAYNSGWQAKPDNPLLVFVVGAPPTVCRNCAALATARARLAKCDCVAHGVKRKMRII